MDTSNIIYLDYASSCPRIREVMDVREQFELSQYANVWRGRYSLAESAEEAYANSKKAVAEWIDCDPVEVLYTYSTTYALNLLALAIEHNGVVGKGDTILLSVSEHHANIVPWQMLAERVGAQVKFVGLDAQYRINLEDLKKKLDNSVKVVSFQYASNVTGAIHSVDKVRDIIGNERFFCVDAAQMSVHGPLSMKKIQCDAMVFSGHKMMADTGIGVLALWKLLQKSWQAPIGGGGAINYVTLDGYQQSGIPERWEPGTPHITGAVTLTAVIEYLQNMPSQMREDYKNLIQFVNEKFAALQEKGVRVFHSDTENALGVWSFSVEGKHVNDIADVFAGESICVRAGHHCCQPLHEYFDIQGTVRISIGFETTQQELERFFEVLETLI